MVGGDLSDNLCMFGCSVPPAIPVLFPAGNGEGIAMPEYMVQILISSPVPVRDGIPLEEEANFFSPPEPLVSGREMYEAAWQEADSRPDQRIS
jgi:hypothetical protein